VLNTGAQLEELIAAVEMARDKILRVLGRDPSAGLAQAREWMPSRTLSCGWILGRAGPARNNNNPTLGAADVC
jgi:hypothetical protein